MKAFDNKTKQSRPSCASHWATDAVLFLSEAAPIEAPRFRTPRLDRSAGRPAISSGFPTSLIRGMMGVWLRPKRSRSEKSGVHGILVYCSDYHCSHCVAISGYQWAADVGLSDLEQRFVCRGLRRTRCGYPAQFDWDKPGAVTRGY
jgi:hypothetical protein